MGRERNDLKYVAVGHISWEYGCPSVGAMCRAVTGVKAIALDSGPDRAKEDAAALTAALRRNVGVSLAPYWGGTFEGKACHKIGRRLAAVCDVLDGFVPQARASAYSAFSL